MQTNCVRKRGAVFFGGHGEIIRGSLTRAKSKRSIIKPKTNYIIKNNAACFSLTTGGAHPHTFLLTRNNQKHHNKYF